MKTMSIIACVLLSLPLFVAISKLFQFFVRYNSPQDFGLTRATMGVRPQPLIVLSILFVFIFALSMFLLIRKKYIANLSLFVLTFVLISFSFIFHWLK